MKGKDGKVISYLTPPSSSTVMEESSSKSGWFGWLFQNCYAGGAAIYARLPSRDPALKDPVASAMSADEIVTANQQLIAKFDAERQNWIVAANEVKRIAIGHRDRSRNTQISSAEREAAKGNAITFAKRHKRAEAMIEDLRKKIENLESANNTLQTSRDNEQYVRAMQANTLALRKQVRDTGMDAESVGEVMDEFAETVGEMQVLNREISRPMMGSTPEEADFDEQDAQDLLDQWLLEESSSEAAVGTRTTPSTSRAAVDTTTMPSASPRADTTTMPSASPTPQPSSRRIPRHFEQVAVNTGAK